MLLLTLAALCQGSPEAIEIAPGVFMPYVNLGGVSSRPSNYSDYLMVGGKGLDTALTYGDDVQKKVAAAMVGSGVARKEVFLTTKVPCCPAVFPIKYCDVAEFNGTTAHAVALDTAILGNVDLLLLHWPCATIEQTVAAYSELEAALAAGKTRAIGVSNFNSSQLEALMSATKVKPAVNQCGHSIGGHNASHNPSIGGDDGTVAFCKAHGVSYSAYSPLGGLDGIDVFDDPLVISIGKKHGVSPAQVALRWLVQQNISIVTAAETPEYIKEDMDLFSFELTAPEMEALAAL